MPPLSPEQINEMAMVLFQGNNIPQADWENLSDADKVAVNVEVERLEEDRPIELRL